MKAQYNVVFTALLLAYSVPGLFLAPLIPFLEDYLGRTDTSALLAAAMIQSLIAYWLFPKIDLLSGNDSLQKYRPNQMASAIVQVAYAAAVAWVLAIEVLSIANGYESADRGSLYRVYKDLAEAYSLEKIKTLVAVISIYLALSGRKRFALLSCTAISVVDFGFGNRGFLLYTLLIYIFSRKGTSISKRMKWLVALLVLIMFGRTYIFSGDMPIEGVDHFLAVFGEFVFTSSAPLFVPDLGGRGDAIGMLTQLFGVDKLLGARAMWVGEIIQTELLLPIGLACGPVCDVYYYSTGDVSLIASSIGIMLVYASFLWLSLHLIPRPKRLPVVLVQALLLRDIIRTGLILSFSTLIQWTVIAIVLNYIFFARIKDEATRPINA